MVIHIKGKTLPEVWENSIKAVWENGFDITTQYDKPGDPPSKDCTAILEIEEPFAEPRIHRCFPGGPVELETYRQEVVDGIHDHWVDPGNGKWNYTYSARLFKYDIPGLVKPINQIQYIIDTLKKCSYSRRAQAITWKPWEDCGISDPACFCAGTRIATPNGEIDIENLKNGDKVYAYDLESSSVVEDVVNYFFKKQDDCLLISLHDREIKVSADQLLHTNRGWVRAKDLGLGDKLKCSALYLDEITDYMMVGYMHGDGWLQTLRKDKRKENTYRKQRKIIVKIY